jgi:hypothetical protein
VFKAYQGFARTGNADLRLNGLRKIRDRAGEAGLNSSAALHLLRRDAGSSTLYAFRVIEEPVVNTYGGNHSFV